MDEGAGSELLLYHKDAPFLMGEGRLVAREEVRSCGAPSLPGPSEKPPGSVLLLLAPGIPFPAILPPFPSSPHV